MPMTLSKVPLSMRGSAVLPNDGYFGPKSPRPKQHLDRSIRFGTTHARDQHTDPQTTLIVSILCYAQRCDLIGPVTIASAYSLLHTACLQTCYEKYRNKLLHITNFKNICSSFSLLSPVATHRPIHRESKKQDTKLLAITSVNIIRFSKYFH